MIAYPLQQLQQKHLISHGTLHQNGTSHRMLSGAFVYFVRIGIHKSLMI